jgi:molybdate transport system substrate-binding protein
VSELRALTSMAPRDVVVDAAALYQAQHPARIEVQSAGGVDVARRIAAGEAVDIVVLARDAIDKLIAAGKLLAADRTDLMESEIAIGVRAGTPHPDVADEQALRTLLLDSASVSYSTGPSGQYLEKLFERWGIYERIRDRIVVPPPGMPVAQLIATGKVVLGFQQLSELIAVPGVEVAGLLPATVQHLTTFSAGISVACGNVEEARRFLRFAASDALDATKKRRGMAPMAPAR